MGYPLKLSQTARPLLFLLLDDGDHVTPVVGATPTVTLSKNGGAFAACAGAVAEIANGWYKVAGNAVDAGTLGPVVLHATAAGADPCDDQFEVVSELSGVLATGDIDGYTLEEAMKVVLAAASGKVSGAATTTIIFRAADDSTDRITATTDDDGNRTAVTIDATG